MKYRGKIWCSNCKKEQPISLIGLSINGPEKTITGFCSVCEHTVVQSFYVETPKAVQRTERDNCIPLHPHAETYNSPTFPQTEVLTDRSVEKPSWVTFIALFSFCLVITYLI